MRALALLSLLALCSPGLAAEPEVPALARDADAEELRWRQSFHQVRKGLAAIDACRARLPDYCSWEYYRSRGDSEVQAYKKYLDARKRGEDVEDPQAGRIFVPPECRTVFETYPGKIELREDRNASSSCRTRIAVLIESIERVESHWTERSAALKASARNAGVPDAWRY